MHPRDPHNIEAILRSLRSSAETAATERNVAIRHAAGEKKQAYAALAAPYRDDAIYLSRAGDRIFFSLGAEEPREVFRIRAPRTSPEQLPYQRPLLADLSFNESLVRTTPPTGPPAGPVTNAADPLAFQETAPPMLPSSDVRPELLAIRLSALIEARRMPTTKLVVSPEMFGRDGQTLFHLPENVDVLINLPHAPPPVALKPVEIPAHDGIPLRLRYQFEVRPGLRFWATSLSPEFTSSAWSRLLASSLAGRRRHLVNLLQENAVENALAKTGLASTTPDFNAGATAASVRDLITATDNNVIFLLGHSDGTHFVAQNSRGEEVLRESIHDLVALAHSRGNILIPLGCKTALAMDAMGLAEAVNPLKLVAAAERASHADTMLDLVASLGTPDAPVVLTGTALFTHLNHLPARLDPAPNLAPSTGGFKFTALDSSFFGILTPPPILPLAPPPLQPPHPTPAPAQPPATATPAAVTPAGRDLDWALGAAVTLLALGGFALWRRRRPRPPL